MHVENSPRRSGSLGPGKHSSVVDHWKKREVGVVLLKLHIAGGGKIGLGNNVLYNFQMVQMSIGSVVTPF